MEQSEGGDFPPKKSQSETAAQQQQPPTASDFPEKKVARQLDFTGYSGGSSTASSIVALLEHPNQSQLSAMVLRPSQLQPQQRPQPHVLRPSQPPKPQSQPQPLITLMPMQQPPVPQAALPPIRDA